MAQVNTYQTGGTLKGDFPGYVERAADLELLESLQNGEFCYVLSARQMGKSSLKVRAIQKLRALGWKCADVDLTRFRSQDATVEQWYFNFLFEVSRAFDLDEEFEDWWNGNFRLTPVGRFSFYWENFLCNFAVGQLAIFIDEIDSILSLSRKTFSTDDFFASLRSVYNTQANNEDLHRLHFCILGVAAPNDLMKDTARTPFNIGKAIHLDNLNLVDAYPLLLGLSRFSSDPKEILSNILNWSGGQPYLTQCLCHELSHHKDILDPQVSVEQAVNDLFLSPGRLNDEANLTNVQRRLLGIEEYKPLMLNCYRRILIDGCVNVDQRKPEQTYLKLSGLVKEDNNWLVVSNKIYSEVFDHKWVNNEIEKLDRPFTSELQKWINSEKREIYLLQGESLKIASNWAAKRDDLTTEEKVFLEESRFF